MATFELPAELDHIHNAATTYASNVQLQIAGRGGCRSLASEALNVVAHSATLIHRSIRTLCEEGWTPVTPILTRTQLDLIATCIATCWVEGDSEYMAFKYLSHFHRSMLTRPQLTAVEKENLTKVIDTLMKGLSAADQQKATTLRAELRPKNYWFQPEYANTRVIFEQAQHPIYDLFRLYSGPTHGGFTLKFLFNDDPALETIDPQEHAGKVPMAIIASTRILAEITHIRDNWENAGAHEGQYAALILDIVALRK